MSKLSNEWTALDVERHNQRVCPANKIPPPADAVEDESDLQSDIRRWCRENVWVCLGGSMAHRTKRTLGEPDMIIIGTRLRETNYEPLIIFVECKAKTGKLTPAQSAMAWAMHRHAVSVHVVRSMSDFLALTK